MARKTTLECQDCVTKFTVSASTPEPIAYCPFCGSDSVASGDNFDAEDDQDDERFYSSDDDDE